jgi:hypothetical protein
MTSSITTQRSSRDYCSGGRNTSSEADSVFVRGRIDTTINPQQIAELIAVPKKYAVSETGGKVNDTLGKHRQAGAELIPET